MADTVAKCIYDFVPETDTDLGLVVGDLVKITKVINDDWYEGVINGKIGQFPKAFVEEMHEVFDVGMAINSFDAEQDGDLSLNNDEFVVITEVIDENWFSGYTQGGKHGMFPKNVIKLISMDQPISDQPNSSQTSKTANSNWVEAVENFTAHSSNELALNIGMKVEVLKEIDDFWCEGRTADGHQGIFPRDFVSLPESSNSHAETTGSVREAKKIVNKLTSGGSSETVQSIGTVVALFSFVASVDGDLTFNEGDEITLLEKIDSNWYRGHLAGNSGIFPANYVKEIEAVDVQNTDQEPLYATVTPRAERSSASSVREEAKDITCHVLQPEPKTIKKKPPERPKLPTIRKPVIRENKDLPPFSYQFKTKSQPTVIIPPKYVKPGQPNVVVLKKCNQSVDIDKSSVISAPTRDVSSNQMFNVNKQLFGSGQINRTNPSFGNSHMFDTNNQSFADKFDKENLKAKEEMISKEVRSINKNTPTENMSTYQKMKCANSNLNSAVTLANAVGIKTTKTEVAKCAVKVGGTAYLTGSASSMGGKPTPTVKPAAIKGFGAKLGSR